MIRIRKSVVATLITVAAVAVIGVSVAHGGPGTAFNPPVKVTPDLGFGYEPATVADGYGNIFVTAHKENWQLARPRDGRICLQWCTGAAGVVAGAWEYLDEDLLLAGAELIWRAGAHQDEKGHGLCHGTSGNGFALLKAFARTGDEL